MELFEIAIYSIAANIRRFTSGTQLERVIELESIEMEYGRKRRVNLSFHSKFCGPWRDPVVGYLTQHADGNTSISGWLELQEFECYYDLLRASPRTFFVYDLEAGTGSRYLTRLGICTNPDGSTEGLTDPHGIVSARFALPSRRRKPKPV